MSWLPIWHSCHCTRTLFLEGLESEPIPPDETILVETQKTSLEPYFDSVNEHVSPVRQALHQNLGIPGAGLVIAIEMEASNHEMAPNSLLLEVQNWSNRELKQNRFQVR